MINKKTDKSFCCGENNEKQYVNKIFFKEGVYAPYFEMEDGTVRRAFGRSSTYYMTQKERDEFLKKKELESENKKWWQIW